MRSRGFDLTRPTGVIVAVAGVVVLGLGGWAVAEGGMQFVSPPAPVATTTTTSGVAAVAPRPASATGNAAVATNTKDGSTVIAVSLKIVKTDDPVVDATNAAVAVARCTDCETVAIALEGVLVTGSPTTFDPTNVAMAVNTGCTNCQTLALAYQDLVQYGTRVRIAGAGRREIADIRKDLDSLRNSGLGIDAIRQRVNQDADRFLAVLRTEVVPVGKPADKDASPTTTTTEPSSPSTTTSTSTTVPEPTTTTPSTTTTVP